jgi:hypothetical protein
MSPQGAHIPPASFAEPWSTGRVHMFIIQWLVRQRTRDRFVDGGLDTSLNQLGGGGGEAMSTLKRFSNSKPARSTKTRAPQIFCIYGCGTPRVL